MQTKRTGGPWPQLIALCAAAVLSGCATVAPPPPRADTPPRRLDWIRETSKEKTPAQPPPSQKEKPPPAEESPLRVHPVLMLGLSSGGDKVGELTYTDGSSQSVKAGGLAQLGGGLLLDFHEMPLQLETLVTYHVDNATATNGEVRFQRWPVEFLGFIKFTPNVRLGGGLQYAFKPELSASLAGETRSARFHDALGWVVEGGYVLCRSYSFAVGLRYAHQRYHVQEVEANGQTAPATSDAINGDQIGINFLFGL